MRRSGGRKRRRGADRGLETLEGILDRAGEARFAPVRAPIPYRVWAEAVGPRVATRARPVALAHGVLTVRVATSTWATELGMLSDPICLALGKRGYAITQLRFRVGAIDDLGLRVEPRRFARVPPPIPLPADLAQKVEHIEDDELRREIARAAAANLAWQANGPTSAPPAARAPRGAGAGSARPDRTEGPTGGAPRGTRGGPGGPPR